jgi:hypothetical protein
MGIPYCDWVTILGVTLLNTIRTSAVASWTRLTPFIRTQAQQAYSRDLNLAQRIMYAQVYMLAKLWCTAQILQPPRECLRQIVSATSWYIWQGAIFLVPLSTVQRRKEEGGWGLTEVDAKCHALLITRLWLQGQREGTMMAAWQRYWQMHESGRNPPDVRRIPQTLGYLRTCVQGIAYLEPQRQGEHPRTFRRRVYWTLRALAEAGSPPLVMRIIQLYPAAHWERIWINLHNCWATEAVKVTWYMVI